MGTMLIGFLVCYLIFAVFMFFRIDKVHKERMRIIDLISKKGMQDIAERKDYNRRWEDFHSGPSNFTMVLKFWIPVKSFFKDAKCIQD